MPCQENTTFVPQLATLTPTEAPPGSVIRVDGAVFFPFQTTRIQLGAQTIPVEFYSSFQCTFQIPPSTPPGEYYVRVVNIYTGQYGQRGPVPYSSTPVFSPQQVRVTVT